MMKRDLLTLAFLVLVAFVGATIVFIVSEISRPEEECTPVAQIPATGSPAPSPSSTDTPVPALEPQHTATQTPTPESTPTPTPCVPPAGWVLYTVRRGDTLYSIAAWFDMTAEEIQLANCLRTANELQTGQTIYLPWLVTPSPTPCVPPADWVPYTVLPEENLFRIAARYGMSTEQLQRANCLASTALSAGQSIRVPYIIPTPVIPEGLQDEIYFNPGGEPEVPHCGDPDNRGEPLQITTSAQLQTEQDWYEMCVYGFPLNEDITVELRTPEGIKLGPESFHVGEEKIIVDDGITKTWTVAWFDLWMPVGMPAGTWSATARFESEEAEGDFVIAPFSIPTINITPAGEINPFDRQKCPVYHPDQADEQVIAHGTGFGPNQNFPLGIYLDKGLPIEPKGIKLVLVDDSIVVATGSQGDFSIALPIEVSEMGAYWVILVTDPEAEEYQEIEVKYDCYRVLP